VSPLRIGVDAGGTFTDFVVVGEGGRVESFKLRSNPTAPAQVILEGLARAAAGSRPEVIHGSTVATNALLERKGARTAFVATAGFEDLIHIGRQNRQRLYDLTPPVRRPLVDRAHCYGVRERTWHDGSVGKAPAPARLAQLRARLERAGITAVAICLLHSYQNPENERQVAAALEGVGFVSCSHDVSPEFREYERASTTVINAYVGPLMEAYLEELERGWGAGLWILQSNGGFMSTAEARRYPVRTVLSGPAGGVVGAVETARASGFRRVLGFDMGGTSTDVSIAEGRPRESTEGLVDGFPVRVPMLDIHTVGAGGGSIARVDAGGLLRVGPESAGADPGPACYGVGLEPTVTDAHVVLGRIAARQFLAGEMTIDPDRSAVAIDRIARALGRDRVAAAEGILRVANANMQRAIRAVSIERGYDPREFALVAFGGCGGLHACELAGELGIRTVIVPQYAEALSALGMLLAGRVRDYAAGAIGRQDFEERLAGLEAQARRDLPGARLERFADLRYRGQSYELTVPWKPDNPAAPFHRAHQRAYGYASPERPVEVVTLRVRARLEPPKLRLPVPAPGGERSERRIWVAGAWRTVPVFERRAVSRKAAPGPALIVDYGATTLAPPGWTFRLDRAGNLLLERQT
jgi:N-methylhydantoinase A/oxoprolinase/acetone carboxylase beta subunit